MSKIQDSCDQIKGRSAMLGLLQRRNASGSQATTPMKYSGTEALSKPSPRVRVWHHLALAIGPGLVVMLADTEAGSVIAAAQSGAQWGYRMVLPQVIFIPILYVVQQMTVRLG